MIEDGGKGFVVAVAEHQERYEDYSDSPEHVQLPSLGAWLSKKGGNGIKVLIAMSSAYMTEQRKSN